VRIAPDNPGLSFRLIIFADVGTKIDQTQRRWRASKVSARSGEQDRARRIGPLPLLPSQTPDP
jgi:hypothetical protein